MKTIKFVPLEYIQEVEEKDEILVKTFDKFSHNRGGYGDIKNIKNLTVTLPRLRFYHSYWSKPALEGKQYGVSWRHVSTLVLSAVSLLCLKKLGQECVLHTDYEGAYLLSCLPYDDIYIDLQNSLNNGNFPINFFASAKILPRVNLEWGIHLDIDFFITDESVIDLLAKNKNVVTNFEKTRDYAHNFKTYVPLLKEQGVNDFEETEELSVNCGLVKLERKLSIEYAAHYFELLHKASKSEALMKRTSLLKAKCCPIDLLIEQILLKKMFDSHQIIPTTILKKEMKNSLDTPVCHLFGIEKFENMYFLLECLRDEWPSVYEKVIHTIRKYDFEFEEFRI